MEIEKITQGEMQRIEKYVQEIIDRKINKLAGDSEEKKQANKKLETNPYLNKLADTYSKSKNKTETIYKKIQQAETKYCASYGSYDKIFSVDYHWQPKNQAERNKKIEQIKEAHKAFTETLIFKGKPEILKAIQAIEKI